MTALGSYRAGLQAPTRIATDSRGNIYVTDPKKGEVLVRASNGRVLSRWRGCPKPTSIAVNDAGTLIYVGDGVAGSVTAYSPDWAEQFKLGIGNGEFSQPNDIALAPGSGDIYVVDTRAQAVKQFSSTGSAKGSFGSSGRGGGQFTYPVALFVDASEILIVDQFNHRVEIFDLDGTFLSSFGGQGSSAGLFNMPQGIWKDALGRIYVTDSHEGWVQVLRRDGTFLAFIGDFGTGVGQLSVPVDLVIDKSNRLIVTSLNTGRLELFGIDDFSNPETIVPATVVLDPQPFDLRQPKPTVLAQIEVPGYPANQVDPATIKVNGVSPAGLGMEVGDHDGNGMPDLRVELPWDALLATLPSEGTASVSVTGSVANKQLEAVAQVQVITSLACVSGKVCSLDGKSPDCNEAVCLEPDGCAVQHKSDGTACDVGNLCTQGNFCQGGVCEVGTAIDCDDSNDCTDDSCDPSSGCVHTPIVGPCEDGNACTVGDWCTAGACSPGSARNCNDGNVCTDDSCDKVLGCQNISNAEPCEDGSACTTGDQCHEGTCASGAPLGCDDGDACTADSCDDSNGCTHAPANPLPEGCVVPSPTEVPTAETTESPAVTPTPTPTATATATATASPEITPGCGDGVVQSGEQCDDGNLVSGDGCSATCTSELIAGGGVSRTDCMLESQITQVAPRNRAGASTRRQYCSEDDPSCDFGPAGDRACTFKVRLCLNVTESRFDCTASDIASVQIDVPDRDAGIRGVLETALEGLDGTVQGTCANRGPKSKHACGLDADCDSVPGRADGVCGDHVVVFSPSLSTADLCTERVLVKVPLGRSGLAASKMIKMAAQSSGDPLAGSRRQRDTDSLSLVCQPRK